MKTDKENIESLLEHLKEWSEKKKIKNIAKNTSIPKDGEKYTSDGKYIVPEKLNFGKIKNTFLKSNYFKKRIEITRNILDNFEDIDIVDKMLTGYDKTNHYRMVLSKLFSCWILKNYFNTSFKNYEIETNTFLMYEYENQKEELNNLFDKIKTEYFS